MAAPPPPPGIFRPSGPHHSIATLVLIENSEEMYPRWNDLRDQYLPTLLGTMRMINPVVPVRPSTLPGVPQLTNPTDSSVMADELSRTYFRRNVLHTSEQLEAVQSASGAALQPAAEQPHIAGNTASWH